MYPNPSFRNCSDESHENDGMIEIIEADEAALSESGLTFRAFADGIYAMAKKGAPEDHTGHVWEFSEFTYEDDGNGKMTKAEAVYVCKNDPEHVDFAEAAFKTQETKPTCTRDGSIGYVLSVSAKNNFF